MSNLFRPVSQADVLDAQMKSAQATMHANKTTALRSLVDAWRIASEMKLGGDAGFDIEIVKALRKQVRASLGLPTGDPAFDALLNQASKAASEVLAEADGAEVSVGSDGRVNVAVRATTPGPKQDTDDAGAKEDGIAYGAP